MKFAMKERLLKFVDDLRLQIARGKGAWRKRSAARGKEKVRAAYHNMYKPGGGPERLLESSPREIREEAKAVGAYRKLYTSAHERLLVFDQREGVRVPYLLLVPRQVLTDVFGGLFRLVPERNRDHLMWAITWVGAGAGTAVAIGLVGVFMGVQLTTAIILMMSGAVVGLVGSRVVKDPAATRPMWIAKRDDEHGIRPIHPVIDIGRAREAASEFLYKRTNRSTIGRAIALIAENTPDWRESIPLGILAALNGGLAFGAYVFVTS